MGLQLKRVLGIWIVIVLVTGGAFASAKAASSFLDLNLKQDRYLGGAQHSTQLPNYTMWAVNLDADGKFSNLDFKANPIGQGAFESPDELYFGVPELYVTARKLAPGFGLTVGRQKRAWSHLDQEFNLGVWQPQLRWDYLAPVQQGLIGIFFDMQLAPAFTVTLFTSPLSVPDQGPQFKIRNGQFESSNRWFVQPQSKVQLFDGTAFSSDAPLFFVLDRPAEEEMIMHSSFGAGIKYQNPDSPLWTQFNYAYKPRNQIHMGIECTNCANIDSGLEITATVHTKIVKHHVITIENGFERADDRGWISLTGDIPGKSGYPDAYAEAPLNNMLIAGGSYEHYIRNPIGPAWLKGSYMRATEFKRKAASELIDSDQVHSSLDRYPFEEVAVVDWKQRLLQKKGNRVDATVRYSYDIPEDGGWISMAADWSNGPMTFSVGADILGAGVDPNSDRAGLFSRYRANDRYFGGMSYVF